MIWPWNLKTVTEKQERVNLVVIARLKEVQETCEHTIANDAQTRKLLSENVKDLRSELSALNLKIDALAKSGDTSVLLALKESQNRLELWRADLESKLFSESSAGRPKKKTPLFNALKNRY
jgi:hypothetical protein